VYQIVSLVILCLGTFCSVQYEHHESLYKRSQSRAIPMKLCIKSSGHINHNHINAVLKVLSSYFHSSNLSCPRLNHH